MATRAEHVAQQSRIVLDEWLDSCTRLDEVSRNTIVVGLRILDSLRLQCPLPKAEILTSGGELKGVRSGLRKLLSKYSITPDFLKGATGRQASPDGQRLLDMFDEGRLFENLPAEDADRIMCGLIAVLQEEARRSLEREHLKVSCSRDAAPSVWVGEILSKAKGRSGGRVEQHLVGAKLKAAHPDVDVPALPAAAADVQTGRRGDFQVGTTVYHVTAVPGEAVIDKCAANLRVGLHPVLLVPAAERPVAVALAGRKDVESKITILAIEDFVSVNILEMSGGQHREFIHTLRAIVDDYNLRIDTAESDKSLKIDLE